MSTINRRHVGIGASYLIAAAAGFVFGIGWITLKLLESLIDDDLATEKFYNDERAAR